MQLLDSTTKLSSAPTHSLLETLQDIADNIQIQSNFCIRHPQYKPLELPAEVINRFQNLPADLQNKYLSLQLQSFLYGVYYNGSLRSALALETETIDVSFKGNLENNTFLGIDLEFYDRLHQSNCGKGYFDPGWQVLRQEEDGSLAVTKGTLILHILRERHLQPADQGATVGEMVSIRMPKNLMQNGFYVAVGNAGSEHKYRTGEQSVTVRVYFHLTPDGAIAVMANLTRHLNQANIPFTFKVLYNPSDYKRYDSGVLYFERSDYPNVQPILQQVYAETSRHFQPQVPLFTKPLAAGLAVAEEPNQKFADRESFGMNRCQMIAHGLLQAWQQGEVAPDRRLHSILQTFTSLGIDLDRPFLNANSEDIYTL